jgi:hypothetical protein
MPQHLRTQTHYLFAFALLPFLFCLVAPQTLFAGGVPQPPAWFVTRLSLVSPTLPDGIDIQSSGESLVIRNTSSTPLYLLRFFPTAQTLETADLSIGLPPAMGTTMKIANDHLWYWEDRQKVWQITSQRIIQLSVYDAMDYFPTLHMDTTSNLDRPPQVQLPLPQYASLHGLFGTDFIALPIVLRHELNPAYDRQVQEFIHDRDQAAKIAESRHRLVTILTIGIGIVYLIIGIGSISIAVKIIKWLIRHLNIGTDRNQQRRDEW